VIGVFVTDRCEARTSNYGKIEGRPRARALQSAQITIGFAAARGMHGTRGCVCVPYGEPRALAMKSYIYTNLERARVARVPHHFTMFSRYRTRNWLIISRKLQDGRRCCVSQLTWSPGAQCGTERAWLNAPNQMQGCASRASRARLIWDRAGRGNARG
jgi:hypothetical protein